MTELKVGTVTSVLGTDVAVVPDGSTSPIIAVDCCGCQASDRIIMQMHATQALAIAIVGGPHVGDRIVETGTSNSWKYQLYASGRITATLNYGVSCATSGLFTASISLPKTMADTKYVVLTHEPNWCIDWCRFNSYDRTTTTVPLVYHVANTENSTVDFMCYLDGTVA